MQMISPDFSKMTSLILEPTLKPFYFLQHLFDIARIRRMNFHKPGFLIISYCIIPPRSIRIKTLCTIVNIHTSQKILLLAY